MVFHEVEFFDEVDTAMQAAGQTPEFVLDYHPTEAELEVTTECQLECYFKDVACWRFSDERNPNGEEMRKASDARQMVNRLNDMGVGLMNIIASGEPTMKRYAGGEGIEVMFEEAMNLPTFDLMLSSHGGIPTPKWNELATAGLRNLVVSYNYHLPDQDAYKNKVAEVELFIGGAFEYLKQGSREDQIQYQRILKGNVDVVHKSWFGRKRLLEVGKMIEDGYSYGGIRAVNWVVTPESLSELEAAVADLTSQGIWVNLLPLDIVPFGGKPEEEFGEKMEEYREKLTRICRGTLVDMKRDSNTRLVNSDRYLWALPDLATTGQYRRCFVPDVVSVTQTGRITYCTYHMGRVGDKGHYNAVDITPRQMGAFCREWAQDPVHCGGCAPSVYDRVHRFHNFSDLEPPGGDQAPNYWFYHKTQVAKGNKDWLSQTDGNLPLMV